MKLRDIPKMEVQRHMSPEIQYMQSHAHLYVDRIIKNTRSFPQISSIDDLPPGAIRTLRGGRMSALYSVAIENELIVIKMRRDGIEAECEALEAWRRVKVPVPTVLKMGTLADTKTMTGVKYLLLDFVLDRSGDPAPTGADYLERHPSAAHRVGRLLGRTLARMHRAKTDRTFGEYADMGHSNRSPYRSWNKYLLGYLDAYRPYLVSLGLTRKLVKRLETTIRDAEFGTVGTYVHGDYSLRNVMIDSRKPLRAVVFDPNPVIGDPSWDIAILMNNRDYALRRYAWEPQDQAYRKIAKREERFLEGFWASYRNASRERVPLSHIRIAQLLQTLLHLATEERKEYARPEEKAVEIRSRRETLFELIGTLTMNS
ncbi:MAG TPA: phosphotransferase [Candidatus Paceibacterota bacterium]|nr:phosphotransferase [Candidatus Paceibacterota bacterium]